MGHVAAKIDVPWNERGASGPPGWWMEIDHLKPRNRSARAHEKLAVLVLGAHRFRILCACKILTPYFEREKLLNLIQSSHLKVEIPSKK